MNQEDCIKQIKAKYGDAMGRICRGFPSLLCLETKKNNQPTGKSLLLDILEKNFYNNRHLGNDIIEQGVLGDFRQFIFSKANAEYPEFKPTYEDTGLSVKELLDKAGYILYQCNSEADVQSFRYLYYRGDLKKAVFNGVVPEIRKGEELCTFNGDQLKDHLVWFALKKNALQLKREDFKNPKRQDEYGTSVISIQFTRGDSALSIKNRYNHTVESCDATFNNNLDNIIPGLTVAFEKEYGVRDRTKEIKEVNFDMDKYVLANDGKFYPYNYKINGNYYCPNNIVINKQKSVTQLPSSCILADYFVVDIKAKKIELYDNSISDSFLDFFKANAISKIDATKDGTNTLLKISFQNEKLQPVIIKLNDRKQIVALENSNLTKCGNEFLYHNKYLQKLNTPNLEECGDYFLSKNKIMPNISLDKLKKCGSKFFYANNSMRKINFPLLESCGSFFFSSNRFIDEVYLPSLEECETYFMQKNNNLRKANFPNLIKCGLGFMMENKSLYSFRAPKLQECSDNFLRDNEYIVDLVLTSLKKCGDYFMSDNKMLKKLFLPNLEVAGYNFFRENNSVVSAKLPALKLCGNEFLYRNKVLRYFSAPNLVRVGSHFMSHNNSLRRLYLAKLKDAGCCFMAQNNSLLELYLDEFESAQFGFLQSNAVLRKLYAPKIQIRDQFFLPLIQKKGGLDKVLQRSKLRFFTGFCRLKEWNRTCSL